MATLTLKKPTPGDLFITDVGIIIPGSGQDTFTEAAIIRRLAISDFTRSAVAGGALVVNNGVSDLSPTLGLEYLENLWVQGGFTITGSIGTQGAQGNQGVAGAGTQGAQGAQGNQGPSEAGVQGPQGNQGSSTTGVQGPQGNQGASEAGVQGAQGNQGPSEAGTEGPQGNQGNQGPSEAGFQGPQGNQGLSATGVQGPQGNQGPSESGFQGPQGNEGPSATGVQGPQGSQGNQGLEGAQGFQGFQGTNPGVQGPQGLQGFQGISGSGVQGTQGAVGSQGNQGFQGANRVKYTFGNTASVPSGGTLQMNGPGNAIQGYLMMRAGAITGAAIQVNTVETTRDYNLEIRINGVAVATVALLIGNVGAFSVALSAAVVAGDVLTAFMVRTTGIGASNFNETTSAIEVTES